MPCLAWLTNRSLLGKWPWPNRWGRQLSWMYDMQKKWAIFFEIMCYTIKKCSILWVHETISFVHVCKTMQQCNFLQNIIICAKCWESTVFKWNDWPISAKSEQLDQYWFCTTTNIKFILVLLHWFCNDWLMVPIKYSRLSAVCQKWFSFCF